MRPSTLIRIGRLKELLAALSSKDMGYVEAAKYLKCSPSAARNYLFELIDAEVIRLAPRQSDCRRAKSFYRITADERKINAYKAALENAQNRLNTSAPLAASAHTRCEGLHLSPVATGYMGPPFKHTYNDVRRDPLVAALFPVASGVPGASSASWSRRR